MELSAPTDTRWPQLSALIAEAMGLYFPDERLSDLRRGLAGAADELGFGEVAACADWLLSAAPTRAQWQVLADHLTIGETYFFRDGKSFDALANTLLPEIIRSRQGGERRLRLWSAGCCTGEEAYSLAILLRQALPDLADWQVTILATDINERFLRKAMAASYGEWSFRGAPEGFKQRYFHRSADGRYVLLPEIRKMVAFEPLNLVETAFFPLADSSKAMDVIFCRNVLMYFAPAQTRAIGSFHRALVDGGCLVVSPSEASQALFPQFVTRNFPGAIIYQKSGAKTRDYPPVLDRAQEWFAPARAPAESAAISPAAQAAPVEARPAPPREPALEAPDLAELARSLANQGRLAEALACCDRWLAADKLNSAAHYLRAVVLLEQGEPEAARRSLQRAIYLDPDFVLAHFALGNLARSRGPSSAADKHFETALALLAGQSPDDLLPESDGLTAGRLSETIAALAEPGNAR